MLNETSNGFQFSVSGHNSASFQWEEHLIVHRLLIKSSADIPEWPGVTWELFLKIFAFNGQWQATTNKGLAKHERCFTILSWCPSNINSVIDLIVHGSTIEIRKTSLSCFCNTFLRSVWTLKRKEFVEELIKMLAVSWYLYLAQLTKLLLDSLT